MDHVPPQKRSEIMRAVHSRDTKPELAVGRLIRRLGFRPQTHATDLPGHPDFVFRSRKKAIFVHGCFWHRHPRCKYATTPKTRTDFWVSKFDANKARDRRVLRELRGAGWSGLVIWQCQLKKPEQLELKLNVFLHEKD